MAKDAMIEDDTGEKASNGTEALGHAINAVNDLNEAVRAANTAVTTMTAAMVVTGQDRPE